MFQAADLPDTIPVFPLSGALLLPRARLPLHVFEPRYLVMLDDVLKSQHRLIGMAQPVGDGPDLHTIGCVGRLTSFSETEDGRYMITLTGLCRFQIGEERRGFTPYRTCHVTWDRFIRDLVGADKDPDFDRATFMPVLKRFFEDKNLSTDWDNLKGAEAELLINSLSMLCPFDPEDKQALLEAPTLKERRETLVALMEYALMGGSGDEVMQ